MPVPLRLHVAEVDRPRPLRAAADGHDEQIAIDDRHAADAEEVLLEVVLRLGIDLPEFLAVVASEAVEHPLGAVDVNAIAVDHRAGPRAGIVAVAVLVVRRVLELPEQLAGLRVAAGEASVVAEAVEVKQLAAGDDRRREAECRVRTPRAS